MLCRKFHGTLVGIVGFDTVIKRGNEVPFEFNRGRWTVNLTPILVVVRYISQHDPWAQLGKFCLGSGLRKGKIFFSFETKKPWKPLEWMNINQFRIKGCVLLVYTSCNRVCVRLEQIESRAIATALITFQFSLLFFPFFLTKATNLSVVA